jgi:hypothetical protein
MAAVSKFVPWQVACRNTGSYPINSLWGSRLQPRHSEALQTRALAPEAHRARLVSFKTWLQATSGFVGLCCSLEGDCFAVAFTSKSSQDYWLICRVARMTPACMLPSIIRLRRSDWAIRSGEAMFQSGTSDFQSRRDGRT